MSHCYSNEFDVNGARYRSPRPFLFDETIFPIRDTFWKQYKV
jgi:hypothetical protein